MTQHCTRQIRQNDKLDNETLFSLFVCVVIILEGKDVIFLDQVLLTVFFYQLSVKWSFTYEYKDQLVWTLSSFIFIIAM